MPSKEVEVGESWEWRGDLLNLYRSNDIVATFTLQEILDVEGESCARITGSIRGWPKARAPYMTFSCETIYSLKRQRPLRASLSYDVIPYQALEDRRIKKIRVRVQDISSGTASGTPKSL